MFFKRIIPVTALATLMIAGAPLSVQAQDAAAPQAATQVNTQFTQEQIEAYADTARDIIEIQKEMIPQIQQAEAKEEKQEIFTSMQQQMMGAVEANENISVAEYNNISQAAQNDPALVTRIETEIKAQN